MRQIITSNGRNGGKKPAGSNKELKAERTATILRTLDGLAKEREEAAPTPPSPVFEQTKRLRSNVRRQRQGQRAQRHDWGELAKTDERFWQAAAENPELAIKLAQESSAATHNQALAASALELLGNWLRKRSILRQLAQNLELDYYSELPLNSFDGVFAAAEDEATHLFRRHRWSILPRDDYHPAFRAIWRNEESALSLTLRFIAGFEEAQEQMAELGWTLPSPTASAQDFEAYFARLSDAAAAPKRKTASA